MCISQKYIRRYELELQALAAAAGRQQFGNYLWIRHINLPPALVRFT